MKEIHSAKKRIKALKTFSRLTKRQMPGSETTFSPILNGYSFIPFICPLIKYLWRNPTNEKYVREICSKCSKYYGTGFFSSSSFINFVCFNNISRKIWYLFGYLHIILLYMYRESKFCQKSLSICDSTFILFHLFISINLQ